MLAINCNMDVIESFVEHFYSFIKALSFCDNMADPVRPYSESVDRITWLIVELHFVDVRVRLVLILLRNYHSIFV